MVSLLYGSVFLDLVLYQIVFLASPQILSTKCIAMLYIDDFRDELAKSVTIYHFGKEWSESKNENIFEFIEKIDTLDECPL